MEYTYKLMPEENLLLEKFVGDINYNDLHETISKSFDELDISSYSKVLTDMREARVNLTWREMQVYAQWIRDKDNIEYVALVVSRKVDFGMSRMFELLTEDDLWTNGLKIFYSYEEAEKWMKNKNVD